jgi:hypothetical protein
LAAILIVLAFVRIIPQWLLRWDLGAQERMLTAAERAKALNDYRSLAIQAVTSTVVVVGVIIAFRQLRMAVRNLKAQVLMKLAEDWRSPEVYKAVTYVNDLRADWKKSSNAQDWPELAASWVSEYAGERKKETQVKRLAGAARWVSEHVGNPEQEHHLSDERLMRRTASQFVARMGALMKQGYISPDDLFRVIPEMGRLLAVLVPIELAILEYWKDAEGTPVAEWDRPVGKWEFRDLWLEYDKWHRAVGKTVNLDREDWKRVLDSINRYEANLASEKASADT